MREKLLGVLACWSICAGLQAAAPAAEQPQPEETDSITRTDGRALPVTKIKSENYLEVKYDLKGQERTIPSYQVKEITRVGADAHYGQALELMQAGKPRPAALNFIRALEAMANQPWAAEYCNYGVANALYEGHYFTGFQGNSGKIYSPPSVYFSKALEANPKSRFLPDISVKLPECLMEEEKFDEADAKVKEAEKRLVEYNNEILRVHNQRDTAKKYLAKLAVVNAHLAERKAEKGKGDWQTALDKWQDACGAKTVEYQDLRAEALDGKLRTLLKMKDYPNAEAEAANLIDKYKKEGDTRLLPVLPGAYYVRGQALFDAGGGL